MGPGPAEGEAGIGYLASMQAGSERWGLLASDCVTVSKDDLARYPVCIHDSVPDVRVVGTQQPVSVFTLPLGDELGVDLLGDPPVFVAFRHIIVKLSVERRVEIGPVLLALQTSVGVRGDDDVGLVADVRLYIHRSGLFSRPGQRRLEPTGRRSAGA